MDQTGMQHGDAPFHADTSFHADASFGPGHRHIVPALSTPLERRLGLALGLTSLWLLLLLLFHLIPAIDIDVQRLFFRALPCPAASAATGHVTPMVCGMFPLAHADTLQAFRRILFNAPTFLGCGLLIVLLLVQAGRLQANAAFKTRATLLVGTLCLGPGLLVNMILKEHSGRPRPAEVDLFGGSMAFRPAGSFDGACAGNCSFVSGEAAGLAWLVLATVLLPRRARRIVMPLIALVSAFGVLLRMGFGRHFLSDIVLGALSTPLVGGWLIVAATLAPRLAALRARVTDASPKSHQ